MKNCHLAVYFTSVIVFGTMFSCNPETPVDEPVVRPVRYQKIYETGGERERSFSGTAKSGIESKLSFKVAGTVDKINVKVGDIVKKDYLIAELDDKDYRLQLQEAEAGLEQANAQALNAKSSYERVRGLYENRNVSLSDLDASRAAYESVNASVRSIEKRLELAKARVSYTKLKAPFSGAVSMVTVEENENVNAGTPIVILTGKSEPEVEVAIPESLISDIKKGDPVTVTFDALKEKIITGIVSEVGIAANPYSVTYPVTVKLKNAGAELRSGMTGEVIFTFRSKASSKSKFIIPSYAVSEDHEGRFVYIVLPTENHLGKVKRVGVTTGEFTGNGIEIFGGITEGDLVITAGVSRIEDGMTVKLLSEEEK